MKWQDIDLTAKLVPNFRLKQSVTVSNRILEMVALFGFPS